MSDTVLIVQACGGVCLAFIGLLIAAVNVFGAIRLAQLTTATKAVATDVAEVKKHTNSMKDALVAATAKASFAEGEKSERDSPTT